MANQNKSNQKRRGRADQKPHNPPEKPPKKGSGLAIRVITAVVFVPIVFACVYFGNWALTGLAAFLAAVGIFEYTRAVNKRLEHPINYVLAVLCALFIVGVMKWHYEYAMAALLAVLIIVFIAEIFAPYHDVKRPIATVFGMVYIPLIFGLFQAFEAIPNGKVYIWMIFVIAFLTDTFAYFVGRFLGRHKLAPAISPKKTIEGSIGGIVFAVAGMIAYGVVMEQVFHLSLPIVTLIIVGVLGSVAGQCGDLAASMIKRHCDVKDFGKILPGHGGVLDRFDSILFVLPIVYVYASFTFGYLV